MIFASCKVPRSFSKVNILTEVLSVCSSLAKDEHSVHLDVLARLISVHIKFILVIWVPGHVGVSLNEAANAPTGASLMYPVT